VHHVRYSTGEAVVVVEAEGLKVNVNKSNPEQIRAVVEKAGVEGDAAEALADVIADFIDKDDIPRLQGAEKDRYRQLGLPYVPFNGPLTSLDQMLLIPGISQQLFYGYGREGNGLGQDETGSVDEPLFPKKHSLFDMFSVYGNNLILRQDEPAAGTGQKRITWENGGIYRILSCGKPSAGSPSVLVWLIVRYVPQGRNGYEVLYRKIL
jgi:hypothetical protein